MTESLAVLPLSHFTAWLAHGERGLSSDAIVSRLTGQDVGPTWRQGRQLDCPHDPADFRRCQLLLRAYPLAGLSLGVMADVSPQWARLTAAWDDIHALLEEEAPGYIEGRGNGSAPRAYNLMRRTIEGGVTCKDCNGSGRTDACPKCKGSGRRSGGRCRNRECFQGWHLCGHCRGRGFTIGGAA